MILMKQAYVTRNIATDQKVENNSSKDKKRYELMSNFCSKYNDLRFFRFT